MYARTYVCIDSSACRPRHTEFENATEFDKTTMRSRAVREASEKRPGGVRGASGRRPRSVRELSERRPNYLPKAFVTKPGPRIKQSGDPARSFLISFVRIVKLLPVLTSSMAVCFRRQAQRMSTSLQKKTHRACAGS